MDWTGSDRLDRVNGETGARAQCVPSGCELGSGLSSGPSSEPSSGLSSGLVGLNLVLFGAALVAGDVSRPTGLPQAPQLFLLVLIGLSLLWMLWYLLWARKQPGPPPHTDHHAGSGTVRGKHSRVCYHTPQVCFSPKLLDVFMS